MLGDSAVLGTGGGGEEGGAGSSGDAVAAVAAAAASAAGAGAGAGAAHDGGTDTVADDGGGGVGGGSNSGDDERGRREEGDRSFGGNRWPRQETLALLKIRSDMDVAFRDASVKGPLWEEVSRKLAELGYHRNAKKCKEKFENVYKYHKRTKEGRSGKSDGKTYRFFDQLEALEGNYPTTTQSPTPSRPPPQTAPLQATPVSIVVTTASLPHPTIATTTTTTVPMPPVANITPSSVPSSHATNVLSTTTLPMSMPQGILNTTTTPSINLTNIPSYTPQINPTYFPPSSTPNPTSNPPHTITPPSFPNIPADLLSNSSSSSTSSDETLEGRRKRKRKWKDFFERLMKEVIEKQEELQRRFLEAIEKREHERAAREEAWRMQEMQRINREREILAQERSMAAAKDAAVMAFLQKIAEEQNLGQALNNITIPQQHASALATTPAPTPPPLAPTPAVQQVSLVPQVAPAPPSQPVVPVAPPQQQQQQQQQQVVQHQQVTNMEIVKADNGENVMPTSSSRWPKVEVQALIKLRTSLDAKYQESGPKGPLWEEISSLMKKIGYNRSAKRCKEKWENINKYFKKVKESNKKRPEDSKTCPYFQQLDALYREKNKLESPLKPESTMAPLRVRPEQQWPPQQDAAAGGQPPTGQEVTMEDVQNDPMDQRHHEEEEEDDDDDDDDDEEKDNIGDEDEDEDDEGGGNNYEIVASKPASVGASVG